MYRDVALDISRPRCISKTIMISLMCRLDLTPAHTTSSGPILLPLYAIAMSIIHMMPRQYPGRYGISSKVAVGRRDALDIG